MDDIKFRTKFLEQIKKDTWEQDLPMVYMDENKNIVKHFKDGKIEIIKK